MALQTLFEVGLERFSKVNPGDMKTTVNVVHVIKVCF